MAASKNGPSKRELIKTGTDKRYVRRDENGQCTESDAREKKPTKRSASAADDRMLDAWGKIYANRGKR